MNLHNVSTPCGKTFLSSGISNKELVQMLLEEGVQNWSEKDRADLRALFRGSPVPEGHKISRKVKSLAERMGFVFYLRFAER